MTQEDWQAGYAKSLAVFLNGEAISEPDPRGEQDHRRQVPAAVQRAQQPDHVHPARASLAVGWEVVIDTARWTPGTTPGVPGSLGALGVAAALTPKSEVEVSGRAVIVLRSTG